mgnify:CR=1 FL=1
MEDQVPRMETLAKIAGFFRRHTQRDLQPDDDIFSLGLVNSLLAVQLVAFVEKEFNITIEDEDLDLDNFKTMNRIVALVEHKTAPAGSSAA